MSSQGQLPVGSRRILGGILRRNLFSGGRCSLGGAAATTRGGPGPSDAVQERLGGVLRGKKMVRLIHCEEDDSC